MNMTTAITITLDQTDYDSLVAEAERRGVPPESVAGEFVHESLRAQTGLKATNERVEQTLRALDRFREITAELPPVDAVAIAREAREELENRPEIP